jgi:hypothetical protein
MAVYAADLVLALMQRVQAFTRFPLSSRVHWVLGINRRIEARMEWERLMVLE